MQAAEARPGHRDHLGRRVQLHGARAQRDHGAIERQVLGLETAQVAHHLGLAVIALEHRVAEIGAAAPKAFRQTLVGLAIEPFDRDPLDPEGLPDQLDVVAPCGLVERDAEMVGIDQAKVDAALARCAGDRLGLAGDPHGDGVEERGRGDLDAGVAQARGQDLAQAMDPGRDLADALRAMPGGVQAGDHGEQDLGGADVAGGFLAPDMLLAGLQRHAQGGPAMAVDRDPDQPARHQPFIRIAGGEEGGMRAAVPHLARRTVGRCRSRCRRPARPAVSAGPGSAGRRP